MKNLFNSKKKIASIIAAATVVVAVFNPKVAGILRLVSDPILNIFYPDEVEQVEE